ncbi:sugar phosphate nucleotidyltransferase [Chloroflexota bacterium]
MQYVRIEQQILCIYALDGGEPSMKGVILVGGEGTRLRPLTCNIPKAIVPILNRPFLEHLLHYLKKHGIEDIILAMGYLPDPIQNCLGDGTRLGVQMTYLVEDSPLGTAGAVKNAESFLNEPFVVFNGDIITEIDLTEMIIKHREIKPKVSIALTPVDNPTIYGVVETDTRGMVKRFVEKPEWDKVTTNMINAGIYIIEPEVLKYIPASAHCMFENFLFPHLLEMTEPVLSYPSDAYWIDIGTPQKYLTVQQDLLSKTGNINDYIEGTSLTHSSTNIKGPVLIAEDCIIAKDAEITGPTVIGSRCKIAGGAVIESAVLWHDSQVGEESVLRNCVVGSHCRIEQYCHVPEDCILGDNATMASGTRLAPGTIIWPTPA